MIKKVYDKVCFKKSYFVLFMIVLTLLSSINMFHSGIVLSDDINFHMHRIMGIVDNIRIGKYVPIYFNYLDGFGYPNGLFYPDLFLFIPALFNYFGLDLVLSLKIFILIINFFSIYFMYLCVYRISNDKKCAYVSMILYAFSTYRFVDLVVRGALGEVLAFVFLPLVLLGLYELFFGDYRRGYWFTIGISCLCFSHVISFYLMVFFSILFFIINFKCLKDKNRLRFLLFYIFLSMLITSHFWLPMLEQLFSDSFNLGINSRIFQNVVPFYLLFFDLPFYGFSEYYPVGIGLAYYIFFVKFFKKLKVDKFVFTIMCFGLVSVFFCSVKLLWKIDIIYKLFNIIQFPWRFYMFSSFFFIVGFSLFFKNICFNKYIKLFFIYLFIIFIANACMYLYNVYISKPIGNEIMMGEYLPKSFDYSIINNYSNDDILTDRNGDVLNVSIVKDVDNIEVPLIYYKGYMACGDKCYDVFKTDDGLVGVKVEKNDTNLRVWYDGTRIYSITKYVSLFGILFLIYKIKKYK